MVSVGRFCRSMCHSASFIVGRLSSAIKSSVSYHQPILAVVLFKTGFGEMKVLNLTFSYFANIISGLINRCKRT